MSRRLLVAAVVASMLGWAAPSSAASARTLTLDDLIDLAEEVVVADVGPSNPRWEGRVIVTDTTVRVRRPMKGAPPRDLVVTQLGGAAVHPRLGVGVTMQASTFTRLEPGEAVVLFLGRRGAARALVGAQQGKLVLREDPGPGGPSLGVGPRQLRVVPDGGGGGAVAGQGMTLDELGERVRARARRGPR